MRRALRGSYCASEHRGRTSGPSVYTLNVHLYIIYEQVARLATLTLPVEHTPHDLGQNGYWNGCSRILRLPSPLPSPSPFLLLLLLLLRSPLLMLLLLQLQLLLLLLFLLLSPPDCDCSC